MVSTFWNIPGIQSNTSLDFLEQALNPICIYDDRGQVIHASPSFLELLQTVKQEVGFLNYFLSQATPQTLLTDVWERALQGETVKFCTKIKDSWKEIECSLQFNPDTNLMFLVAKNSNVNGDADRLVDNSEVDDYQQAIAALVRTEEKWKTFVLKSPYLFIQTNNIGQIIYISPAAEELLGYQTEELLGLHLTEFVHPNNLNEFELTFQTWLSSVKSTIPGIECWWRTKFDQWICVLIQGQSFPSTLEIDGIMISGHNITDRKCLEAKLRISEEKYQSVVSMISGAVFRCDASYTIKFVSRAIETITGYPASILINASGQSYLSIVHPDDIAILKDALVQTVLDQCRCSIEYRIIHADGSVRWVLEQKQGVFDQAGRLLWLDGILLDIHERKRLEVDRKCDTAERRRVKTALHQAEAINRAMVHMVPILMRSNCLEYLPTLILSKNIGLSN